MLQYYGKIRSPQPCTLILELKQTLTMKLIRKELKHSYDLAGVK